MNSLRRFSAIATNPNTNSFKRYSVPLTFFAIGCACEAYTGTQTVKETTYTRSSSADSYQEMTVKKTRDYS